MLHTGRDPADRTGRQCAPAQDPGAKTQSLPFAALPHELRKDPRLKGNRTAIVLAAALLEYARARDSCWPSNRRLAEDLGCCQQTVRNALAALQAAGWVRVEHGASNPTGRVIWLTWRAGRVIPPTPSNRLDLPLKTAGEPPLKPVGPESRIVVVEEREESPKFACERSRPETPPTLIPDPECSAAPTPLRAPPVVLDCQPAVASPLSQPGAAEPLAPAPPVIDPPQPELSVAASAPVVVPPQPQSPTLRKLGLGPRAAYPALRTPSAWSLPAPSPRPGPASLLLTPELSVAAPAPVVAPPQPQSPTLRKLGLGPRAARPALKTPPAGSPAPSPALPLTPEQQARLAAMPAASRDQVLLWLATGDPILVAEARKKLAPLRPHLEAPKTLPELLGRIREDPSYPALAASGLAAALQDPKSYSGYLRRCEEAWRGELNPDPAALGV